MPLPTNGPPRPLLNQYMGPAAKAGPKDLIGLVLRGGAFEPHLRIPCPKRPTSRKRGPFRRSQPSR